MARIIRQSVVLPATPERLYAMYLSPRDHAAIIDAGVKIGRRVGAKFSAWDGDLYGTILQLVPGKLIVQSWRASDWAKSDPDSTLILSFHRDRRGGRIDLVHVNVPDKHAAGVRDGWREFYWKPWRAYLKHAA
jgi:activator of HSP90 ATPase